VLDRSRTKLTDGVQCGAYVLADLGIGKPQIILMASGTEVSLIVEAGLHLAGDGFNVRLVSFPSWELFEDQGIYYQNEVLPADIKVRLAVEAGVTQGWEHWVGPHGAVIGMSKYGASAPYKTIYEHYGFTANHIYAKARQLLGVEDRMEFL
jgi:transketolase